MENERPNASARNLVLLVDDNQTHQYSLGKHLVDAGFQVIHSHTGAETLAMTTENHPDVILLDINLPDILGFEVCQKLKEDPATAHIPIIFHSATHNTQNARSRASDLGAFSFLSYPIDIDHLLSVVRGAITKSKHSS